MTNLFHLAFPVTDLGAAREFYGGILGCEEGRSSDHWIDFSLYGHQIVAHLAPESAGVSATNNVDADHVPVPHFGIVLPMKDWRALADRLNARGVGEQATMFFLDPSGNALEFKGFNDFSQVFAK
jgi:extradiol dioxygenase family protein